MNENVLSLLKVMAATIYLESYREPKTAFEAIANVTEAFMKARKLALDTQTIMDGIQNKIESGN